MEVQQIDGTTVTVLSWDTYNPRKDLKATSWFRLQNSLFEDPNFYDFSHSELLVWIYLLMQCSKKQAGTIRLNLAHAERVGRLRKQDIASALEKLELLQCVHTDVTSTSRERHADVTLRTNETNERNERDTATSGSPPVIAELADGVADELVGKTKPEQQRMWVRVYPDAAWIKSEARSALAWIKANPQKAPRSDFARFLNQWLAKAWERHRKDIPAVSSGGPVVTPRTRRMEDPEIAEMEARMARIRNGEGAA